MKSLAHSGFNHSRSGLKAGLAAAALAAFSAFACASMPRQAARPSTIAAQTRADVSQPATAGRLRSEWKGGECMLDKNVLSYSSIAGRRDATLALDASTDGAEKIICSDECTVIVTPTSAVIAPGGSDVAQGREMLGLVGGQFVFANSVTVRLDRVVAAGAEPLSATLDGRELSFAEPGGRRWRLDVSDPFGGWNVY
jgi:hypothetical protein